MAVAIQRRRHFTIARLMLAVLLACAWLSAPAAAAPPQETKQAGAGEAQAAPVSARAQHPTPDEQIDVWEYLRKRRKKAPATSAAADQSSRLAVMMVPVFASKPSTGLSLGVGASLERPHGDLRDTFVSSTLMAVSFSTKKFYTVSMRPTIYGAGDRWLLSGDNHFQKAGQETHGLGSGSSSETGIDARYQSIKFVDTYYRRIWKSVYGGAGLQYQRHSSIGPLEGEEAGWDQSPFVEYSTSAGFDLSTQTAAGLTLGLRHDSRDSVSDPEGGWYAEALFKAHMADFLGGTSTWQRLYVDARAYRPIKKDSWQTLAFWTFADIVSGGTAPYFALPANGTDPLGRSARGYADGRFRGDRLVYGEVEYRLPLRRDGLVGMVGFLNATTVGSTYADEALFDSVAVGAGFGFRLRLQKRSRTNLCLDFGWGRDGSHGVYIAVAEAF